MKKKERLKKYDKKATRLFIIGILLLITGFIILSQVNSMADNFAGYLAPLVIVSSWIVIAIALWKIEE